MLWCFARGTADLFKLSGDLTTPKLCCFGSDCQTSKTRAAGYSDKARAARAKCSLAGLTTDRRETSREEPRSMVTFFSCCFNIKALEKSCKRPGCPDQGPSRGQGWWNELKSGGATFEFSFTMLSRRRFAPPRSH